MKYKLLPLFFFLAVFAAQAQTKVSTDPAQYVADAKNLLIAGKATNAEQLGTDLEAIWNNGSLTAKQKQQVVDISQRMYRKKLRANPHFENFYEMLIGAFNHQRLRSNQIDDMLEVVDKVMQHEEGANLDRFLSTSSRYLTSGVLYQNKQYTLRTSGGNLSFAYEGKAPQKEKEKGKEGSEWDNFSWDDEVAGSSEETVVDGWGTVTAAPKKIDPKAAEKKRREDFKKMFVPAQPKVSGPVLKLDNANLTFATIYDSTTITKTSGQLMLANNLFVGEGGSFAWVADGKPVSADFRAYNFDITAAAFKVPDATITYNAVLDSPIEGIFEFRSTKAGKNGEKSYPRFASFTNDAKVKSLGKNIAYTGGFTLAGDVVGSKPLDGSVSSLAVLENGQKKFRSMAHNYNLSDSIISANRAYVAIYQNQRKDSLTHPAMQLHYSKSGKELILTKDKGVYSKTPFYDSYHKFEIAAERLAWELESPFVNFSILNTKTLIPVQLESAHYYSNIRYQQLVGVASFHPLQVLVSHAAKAKTSQFYAADVAKASRINESAIREAALNLAREGYLEYDGQSHFISLKPKAWHYVGSAQKLSDYDHIIIKSVVPSGRNATLNLSNNRLTVRGVDRVAFNNDSSTVYALPDSNVVHLLDNRNMEFGGRIYAGRLNFRGSQFKFNYQEFMIDMQKLDTVAFVTKKRRTVDGKEALEQVMTSRSGKMSGKLYINKPNNKSGRQYFSDYPKFDSPMGGQVAFSRPDVLAGAYDSTVYFEIPSYKLDSLSRGKGSIGFSGVFHSGGIFPPIKTKLTMMPDETLGFYYQPGPNGLKAFGGKGIAYDTIMMSAAGIQSKGTLKYLTSTFEAPEFTYLLDRVITDSGTNAKIEPGGGAADFPTASFSKYKMNWMAKQDTMYVFTEDEPMKLYKDGYRFKGTAKISPGGLYADGELDNEVANIVSDKLLFKSKSFSGNHAQMIVKSDVEGRPAMKAQDMAINYDLTQSFVEFGSEQKGAASIEFPKAQYKTSMSRARWDMKGQKVSLSADGNGGKNYFYSQHPGQQGLHFSAATGEYDLKSSSILAGGVPYIPVGDVHVIPHDGKVAVESDATIKTLRNARVMADSVKHFHKLHSGNIDVLSRNAFSGVAVRNYQNAAADSFKLQFTDFAFKEHEIRKKEKVNTTYALAQVKEDDNFYIFPKIRYRGDVKMYSYKPYMDFSGDLKLNFTGNDADSDWFPFKRDSLNPDNVRIPILKQKASNGSQLYTGLHLSRGTLKPYNTFVSKKQYDDDLDIFVVDGDLSYDKQLSEFKLVNKARSAADSYEGSELRYNEGTKTVHFEGKLNLVSPLKNFNIESAGSGIAKVDSGRYDINALMAFDMTMPTPVIVALGKKLAETAYRDGSEQNRDEEMLFKLGGLVGNNDVRKYRDQGGALTFPKLSNKLVRSLVFSNVDLRWSNEKNAWYSVGKLSLANVMKEEVGANIDGFMEIRQDSNGEPVVGLYLQPDQYNWVYLQYMENGLVLISSDPDLNKTIRSKASGGRGSSRKYALYMGEDIDKNRFVDQFRHDYLKGKDSFKMAAPSIADQGGFNFAEEEEDTKKKKKKKKGKGQEEEEWQ
ncbi:hypothetical protein H9Q13_15275 [Pontibacter sp. JH31]|uniref:Uncharacterized protein n=1 Tax=Pontibacter aquaedesilientis TaxID=2766980 RepID=A0ABR7XJT5_9BACT|nr:hypothetical protein [Pontibacter aquaedesilientis]MBD1398532.1 hypothetical protein [Pontibacter aquaedesilientis]